MTEPSTSDSAATRSTSAPNLQPEASSAQGNGLTGARLRALDPGNPPLPAPERHRYRSERSGVFQLGADPKPFEDELDLYVEIVESRPDSRQLDWSLSSAGTNPDDGDPLIYGLEATPEGLSGSFLGVYAGGMPTTDWDSPPLYLPARWSVGQSWETSGQGAGVDEHRGPYTDRFEIRASITGERSVRVNGNTYTTLSIEKSWNGARRYERTGKEELVEGDQLEHFSPTTGLVLCSTTKSELSGGHRVDYRATLSGSEDCPLG